MKLYPYHLFLACGVPKKGLDPLVVSRISRFIREMGLVHFAYRCDREASLNAMLEEAISRTGRTGKRFSPDSSDNNFPFPVAVPEEDEPDAVTEVPAPVTPVGPTIAVPEVTHPGNRPPMVLLNVLFAPWKTSPEPHSLHYRLVLRFH